MGADLEESGMRKARDSKQLLYRFERMLTAVLDNALGECRADAGQGTESGGVGGVEIYRSCKW